MKNRSLIWMVAITFLLSVFNVGIAFSDVPGGQVDPSCDSGGPGSTSCTVKYEGSVGGGGASGGAAMECSVTCSEGTYACCSISSTFPFITCKCKGGTGNTSGTSGL